MSKAAEADGTTATAGAGGKFRKRPFRRPQTTPYDRPPPPSQPTALTNNNNSRWLSKLLVDPASKLISSTAHYFLSSLRRTTKRLPPPPQHQPPEANQEIWKRHQETVPINRVSAQESAIDEDGDTINSSHGGGISDVEQILKQKTFTRSEIDRLTELLHSRTVDLSARDEDKRTEANLPKPVSDFGRHQEFGSTSTKEKRITNNGFRGVTSTPSLSSRVPDVDVASPAELANAYMDNWPSKVLPSTMGLRSQAPREEAILPNNVPFPPKSPIMSPVPNTDVRVGVSDNFFTTQRPRSRSAIYSMALTPYSRVYPTASQKATERTNSGYGVPTPPPRTWEPDRQLGSKQALKRRSFVLDDIRSVGSMRRIRQKLNLLSQGAPLSIDSAQHSASSTQNLLSMGEDKDKDSKTGAENDDSSFPSTSYASGPAKSSDMATKILQHLEKLTPKEKSSESRLAAARDKSPAKLTPKMLRGQALRSLEDVDSSKLLDKSLDSHQLEDLQNKRLPEARGSSDRMQDKVEENGPKKFSVPLGILKPAVDGDTAVSVKAPAPTIKTADSIIKKLVTQPPQKKWAFQMSVHEDSFDLDDDTYSNGPASTLVAEGREEQDTSEVQNEVISADAITPEKAPALPGVNTSVDLVLNKGSDLETYGSVVGDTNAGFGFLTSHAPSTSFLPAVTSQATSAFDKIDPPKEENAPPLFSFSSKNIDKVPPFTFSSPPSDCEISGPKSNAWSDSKTESSNSLVNGASGPTDAHLKIPEFDKDDNKSTRQAGNVIGKSETSPSAVSTSTSAGSIFSFGNPTNNSIPIKVSIASSQSIFSTTAPVLASNTFPNQNFTNNSDIVASSTSTATLITTGSAPASTAASNSNLSVTTSAPSFSASPIFKFGSSVSPSTSVSAFTTSSKETTDTKDVSKKEMTFGNVTSSPFVGTSVAIASTGSNLFGLGSSVSSTSNNQSQGSPFIIDSESMVSAQPSSTGFGVATVSQSMTFPSSSSGSSPIFGTSGITSFTSSSSLFGSSTPAELFGSGTSFGASSSASVSNSDSASTIFGSSWQPTKSPVFDSTFNTASPSTGFSFGASSSISVTGTNNAPLVFGSSASATSASIFSFTTASAMTSSSPSLSQTQLMFGNSTPVFTTSGNGGDQMNMEDSMAEDPVQASTPAVPIFGQPHMSSPPPAGGFGMFGSTVPSPASPFQFGGQQNQAVSQNLSPFQASSSLEFSAGGSFSLGASGNDKSTRKIIRPNKYKYRKK